LSYQYSALISTDLALYPPVKNVRAAEINSGFGQCRQVFVAGPAPENRRAGYLTGCAVLGGGVTKKETNTHTHIDHAAKNIRRFVHGWIPTDIKREKKTSVSSRWRVDKWNRALVYWDEWSNASLFRKNKHNEVFPTQYYIGRQTIFGPRRLCYAQITSSDVCKFGLESFFDTCLRNGRWWDNLNVFWCHVKIACFFGISPIFLFLFEPTLTSIYDLFPILNSKINKKPPKKSFWQQPPGGGNKGFELPHMGNPNLQRQAVSSLSIISHIWTSCTSAVAATKYRIWQMAWLHLSADEDTLIVASLRTRADRYMERI
jgi:hypothetical protein